LLKIPHLSIRSDFDAEFQRSTACVFLHHPLMGIEKAVKAMAASAGTTVPEKNFDGPVPDKNPGGPAPEKNSGGPVRVTVTNLNGETLLEQDFDSVNSADVLSKIPSANCFDKLTLGGDMVSGNIPVPAGSGTVSLILVRLDLGVLSGVDEEMMKVLQDFGAIQEVPAPMQGKVKRDCVSMAKRDNEHCSGGGFGDTDRVHHVMLLPDGRILAKYHYADDYMEHSGDYKGTFTWEIAEGQVTPADEPGVLEVEWTGWAELVQRSTKPFGPGEIESKWEAKVIDKEAKRGPSTLVPTEHGRLSLTKLCEKWAKEDSQDYGCARTKSVRVEKGEAMPNLSEEILKGLSMNPAHLTFWQLK